MAVSPRRPKGPHLNALRAFEATARLGSFSMAAEELSVTAGAVTQHVKALEAWAGTKLFARKAHGVELTPLAEELLWVESGRGRNRIISFSASLFRPPIFACDEDMGPSEGRDVRQEAWGTIQPCAFSLCNGLTKLICAPIDNDGGQEIKARHAVMLPLGRAVSYFTLTPNPQRIL